MSTKTSSYHCKERATAAANEQRPPAGLNAVPAPSTEEVARPPRAWVPRASRTPHTPSRSFAFGKHNGGGCQHTTLVRPTHWGKKTTCAPLLIVRPLDQIEEDVQELISFFRLWVKASGAKDERDQLLGEGEKQKQRRSQIRVFRPRGVDEGLGGRKGSR